VRPILAFVTITALFIAGCGGGATGVPGGAPGTISGVVSTSATLSTRTPSARIIARQGPTVRRSPSPTARFVPDQVLVKFRTGVLPAQAQESHRLAGGAEMKRFARTGVTLVRITSGESVSAVLARYRNDPRVEYAEPNHIRYLMATPPRTPQAAPNDPGYPSQWHYGTINLPAAWDVTTGSSLVIVAVIDSGMLFGHPDVQGVTVAGWDFVGNDSNPQDPFCPAPDDFAHGTHVAGTVAAATNNGQGVAGTNWGGPGRTRIMPLRVFGDIAGSCGATSDDIIDAIEWAADHSARVINMSFGGPGFNQAEQNAVTYAFNTGVTLVAAAGNDNVACSNTYPANYANVIGVAATNINNQKASYSNFGTCVDVAAPGGDNTNDVNQDGEPDYVLSPAGTPAAPADYFWSAGTSMASPHVAGLAALLISKGVAGPASIETAMESTATNLGGSLGAGLINAASAVGVVGARQVKVFAGTINGNTITRVSDTVNASANGAYVVTGVTPGTWTVFAWQDTNGNGSIDASDLYGSVAGIVVTSGAGPAGVNLSVKEVPLGSTPITVSGTRTGPAMAVSSARG
jgi:subtilisin family serine protease